MNITVQGYEFGLEEVQRILRVFLTGPHVRTKQTLVDILRTHVVPEEILDPAAKRLLKFATDEELARYDPATKTYVRIEPNTNVHPLFGGAASASGDVRAQDGPSDAQDAADLLEAVGPANFGDSIPLATRNPAKNAASAHEPAPRQGFSWVARGLCLLISGGAILAVVSINGLFAASIAGTPVLAAILITALVSIDLMRPFLVAMALISFKNRLWLRFCGALGLALVLAPLSVFTSFSMLSAEFSKGAETRLEARLAAGTTTEDRAALEAEIARLSALSEAQWGQWNSECANGGCGPQAGRLQDAAQATDARIAELVAARQALSNASTPAPDRASRITTSLTLFGIAEARVVQLAPLLLALGLELAAVLGPSILLVPITAQRPSRAARLSPSNNDEGDPS